jgi:hypothetical protein
MGKKIVVLSDGETWSELRGAKVMALTDEQYKLVAEDGHKPKWFLEDHETITILDLDIFET